MKLERAKNTKKNIIWGMLTKILTIIIPFSVQTVFIRELGSEYNGLKGLFSSILQILNLAELGFGSALVFSMYKPIAEDDNESVCNLLNLYRKIYKVVGGIILLCGLLITPFLSLFIKDSPPDSINIYLVFILYLINTVLSYLFFAYKTSLLNAYQRIDVINIISLFSMLITSTFQIVELILTKNFYLYIIILIFNTIINNLCVYIYVSKKYPSIKPYGKVDSSVYNSLKKQIYGLAIGRICGVTRNSFDNLFLTAFLGLSITGMYSNYYYIFSNVIVILSVFTSAMLAGIGNSICCETVEKNYSDFILLDYIYMLISGWFSLCMLCLYQPFIKIWIGQEFLFDSLVPVLMTIYFYVVNMGNIRCLYSDAAGLWWENKNRVILEGIANILLNYFLGKYFGVYGIIVATCISIFIFGYGAAAFVLFRKYFEKKNLIKYFMAHILYFCVTLMIGCFSFLLCYKIIVFDSVILDFLIKFLYCAFCIPLIYIIIYCRTKILKEAGKWLYYRIIQK